MWVTYYCRGTVWWTMIVGTSAGCAVPLLRLWGGGDRWTVTLTYITASHTKMKTPPGVRCIFSTHRKFRTITPSVPVGRDCAAHPPRSLTHIGTRAMCTENVLTLFDNNENPIIWLNLMCKYRTIMSVAGFDGPKTITVIGILKYIVFKVIPSDIVCSEHIFSPIGPIWLILHPQSAFG